MKGLNSFLFSLVVPSVHIDVSDRKHVRVNYAVNGYLLTKQ